MDLNRFNRRRTSRIYLYILLLIACSFLSFLLGVVMLRNGTLRKLYDIYDAVDLSSERIPYIKATEKPDTLHIQLSKKNYNRLVKLRSDSFLTPKTILTTLVGNGLEKGHGKMPNFQMERVLFLVQSLSS